MRATLDSEAWQEKGDSHHLSGDPGLLPGPCRLRRPAHGGCHLFPRTRDAGPSRDTIASMPPLRVLLVSADLMATSRMAGLAREAGAELETLAAPHGAPRAEAYDVVLLDLQSLPGEPATLVARARHLGGATAKVVAFGPHVWREKLDAALAAGADDAVSRGEVLGGLPGLLAGWTSST